MIYTSSSIFETVLPALLPGLFPMLVAYIPRLQCADLRSIAPIIILFPRYNSTFCLAVPRYKFNTTVLKRMIICS